ncbi:hypothetical protein BH09ACT3_BH09ACT3_03800 [soil metagenome]
MNASDSAAATRNELRDTLDAIEEKLNVPKQVGRLTTKAKEAYESNPVPWIIGATAAVIVVGGLVAWALFSRDD